MAEAVDPLKIKITSEADLAALQKARVEYTALCQQFKDGSPAALDLDRRLKAIDDTLSKSAEEAGGAAEKVHELAEEHHKLHAALRLAGPELGEFGHILHAAFAGPELLILGALVVAVKAVTDYWKDLNEQIKAFNEFTEKIDTDKLNAIRDVFNQSQQDAKLLVQSLDEIFKKEDARRKADAEGKQGQLTDIMRQYGIAGGGSPAEQRAQFEAAAAAKVKEAKQDEAESAAKAKEARDEAERLAAEAEKTKKEGGAGFISDLLDPAATEALEAQHAEAVKAATTAANNAEAIAVQAETAADASLKDARTAARACWAQFQERQATVTGNGVKQAICRSAIRVDFNCGSNHKIATAVFSLWQQLIAKKLFVLAPLPIQVLKVP